MAFFLIGLDEIVLGFPQEKSRSRIFFLGKVSKPISWKVLSIRKVD